METTFLTVAHISSHRLGIINTPILSALSLARVFYCAVYQIVAGKVCVFGGVLAELVWNVSRMSPEMVMVR